MSTTKHQTQAGLEICKSIYLIIFNATPSHQNIDKTHLRPKYAQKDPRKTNTAQSI